jgi:hypothetical protein
MTVHQWLGQMHFWSLMLATWVLLFICWRPYRLDALRDALFRLRDELFLLATDEQTLAFKHSAYTGLRNDLNGMIRFAEKMTFMRALLFWLIMPKALITSEWGTQIIGLPLHVQKKLVRIRTEASMAVGDHVINGSLPLLILIYALQSAGRANHFAKTLVARVRSAIVRPLEAQARDEYRLAS